MTYYDYLTARELERQDVPANGGGAVNVEGRRARTGVYLVATGRGGVVGLVSNLQWAILQALSAGCTRRQLGAAVYGDQTAQTAAQRAALSRSVRRLEGLGLLAAGAITEEGRELLPWLQKRFSL